MTRMTATTTTAKSTRVTSFHSSLRRWQQEREGRAEAGVEGVTAGVAEASSHGRASAATTTTTMTRRRRRRRPLSEARVLHVPVLVGPATTRTPPPPPSCLPRYSEACRGRVAAVAVGGGGLAGQQPQQRRRHSVRCLAPWGAAACSAGSAATRMTMTTMRRMTTTTRMKTTTSCSFLVSALCGSQQQQEAAAAADIALVVAGDGQVASVGGAALAQFLLLVQPRRRPLHLLNRHLEPSRGIARHRRRRPRVGATQLRRLRGLLQRRLDLRRRQQRQHRLVPLQLSHHRLGPARRKNGSEHASPVTVARGGGGVTWWRPCCRRRWLSLASTSHTKLPGYFSVEGSTWKAGSPEARWP